jgi:hypothetical protein
LTPSGAAACVGRIVTQHKKVHLYLRPTTTKQGDRMSFGEKMGQNIAQLLSKLIHKFYRIKNCSKNFGYFYKFKKLKVSKNGPKYVSNHPKVEKSPNLVTLPPRQKNWRRAALLTRIFFFFC